MTAWQGIEAERERGMSYGAGGGAARSTQQEAEGRTSGAHFHSNGRSNISNGSEGGRHSAALAQKKTGVLGEEHREAGVYMSMQKRV